MVTITAEEVEFTFSNSGGPGGQNVNTRKTQAHLTFDFRNSVRLSAEQKQRIEERSNRINAEGLMLITCSETRSALRNKERAVEILNEHLAEVLRRRKKRVPTRPSKAAIQKRLTEKKHHSDKKQKRKITEW